MRRILLATSVLLAGGLPLHAQQSTTDTRALVVSTCGTQTFPLTIGSGQGDYAPLTQLPSGLLCVVTAASPGSPGGTAADQTGTNASDGQATSTNNQHALVFPYLWNGSTFDRWPGSAANGAKVQVGNFPAAQSVTNGGTFAVQNTAATPAGTNIIGGISNTAFGISGTLPAFASTPTFNIGTGLPTSYPDTAADAALGTTADSAYAGSGSTSVVAALKGVYNATLAPIAAGTNAIGTVGQSSPTTAPFTSAEQGSSVATVGITPAITTSGTSLVGKASAGNFYGGYATNATTTAGYFVTINAAAVPAAAAAISAVECIPIQGSVGANAAVSYGAGPPDAYATGIVLLLSTSCSTYTAGPSGFIKARVR